MAGYTPVFAEIYTGSLYGKWPAAAVWASLLPLADKHGYIDMSLQAIAGMTGWPVDLLEQGIDQLMQPDPNSRTPDEDGRRLMPIDPNRAWGWVLVNHGKYREKARLQSKAAREVETRKNAERMKDRRRPPVTAGDRPSNANTNIKNTTAVSRPRHAYPDEFESVWTAYPNRLGGNPKNRAFKAWNARRSEGHTPEEMAEGVERYARFCNATNKTGTELVKQAATFFGPDKGFLETWQTAPKVTRGFVG